MEGCVGDELKSIYPHVKRVKALVFKKLHRRWVERNNGKSQNEMERAKHKRKAEKISQQMTLLKAQSIHELAAYIMQNLGRITPIDNEQLPLSERNLHMMAHWAAKDRIIVEMVEKSRENWKDVEWGEIINDTNSEVKCVGNIKGGENENEIKLKENLGLSKKKLLRRKKLKQKVRKRALFEALQAYKEGYMGSNASKKDDEMGDLNGEDKMDVENEVQQRVEMQETKKSNAENETGIESVKKKNRKFKIDKHSIPRELYLGKLREARKVVQNERKMKRVKRKAIRKKLEMMEMKEIDVEGKGVDVVEVKVKKLSANKSGRVSKNIKDPEIVGVDKEKETVKRKSSFFLSDNDANDNGDCVSDDDYIKDKAEKLTKDNSKYYTETSVRWSTKFEEKNQTQDSRPVSLHPSWEAKLKQQRSSSSTSFQGKKITFSDSDDD